MRRSIFNITTFLFILLAGSTASAKKLDLSFSTADTNQDGSVDAAELAAIKTVHAERRADKKNIQGAEREKLLKKTQKRSNNRFKQADANGDGKLDAAEYEKAMEKQEKK
jgi:Ca2+-binding EF-hand superfamily protein